MRTVYRYARGFIRIIRHWCGVRGAFETREGRRPGVRGGCEETDENGPMNEMESSDQRMDR